MLVVQVESCVGVLMVCFRGPDRDFDDEDEGDLPDENGEDEHDCVGIKGSCSAGFSGLVSCLVDCEFDDEGLSLVGLIGAGGVVGGGGSGIGGEGRVVVSAASLNILILSSK